MWIKNKYELINHSINERITYEFDKIFKYGNIANLHIMGYN